MIPLPKEAKPHERAVLIAALFCQSNKQIMRFLGYRSHTSVSEVTAKYKEYLCRQGDNRAEIIRQLLS